jgi:hypothetical protein
VTPVKLSSLGGSFAGTLERGRARSLGYGGHHPEAEAYTVDSAVAAGAGAVGTSAHVLMRAERTHLSVPRIRGSTVVGAHCELQVDFDWLPFRALGAIRR